MFANGWELLATFLPFLQQLATFPHFANFCLNLSNSLATFGSFCQLLPMFATGWKLLAIFYIFLQYLAISRQLLIPVDNVWQLFTNFAQFGNVCQLFATLPFLTTFGNIWQLLSSCCLVLSPYHLVIWSYCHLYVLSFCPFVILSVWQPVKMSACQFASLWASQLVNFSAWASWSLRACFTYLKYDKLWGLPRRVFTLLCYCAESVHA